MVWFRVLLHVTKTFNRLRFIMHKNLHIFESRKALREARKHDHKIKAFDLQGNDNRWVGVHSGTTAQVPVLSRTVAREIARENRDVRVVDLGKNEERRWGVELNA